jgi:hypothetical protein
MPLRSPHPCLSAAPCGTARFRAALTACLVIAFLGAALQPAQAKTKHLWSTVNICDSPKYADSVGVAARMPGDGTARQMYMRFYVQYREDKKWKYVKEGGQSPWLKAGSAKYTWSQRGYTFGFDPPAAGTKFILRGLVKFEWRGKGGKVVKKTHRITSSGHETKGADPAGYSAAQCTLEGPAAPAGQPPYQDPNAPPQG